MRKPDDSAGHLVFCMPAEEKRPLGYDPLSLRRQQTNTYSRLIDLALVKSYKYICRRKVLFWSEVRKQTRENGEKLSFPELWQVSSAGILKNGNRVSFCEK